MLIRFLTQNEFPPFPTQAANLAKAAGQAAAPILRGEHLAADQAERDRRKAICDPCPNQTAGRCRLCGCWLEYRRRMAIWQCPENTRRW